MANLFKRYKVTATTSSAVIYTVPNSTTSVIIGLQAANKSAAQQSISVLHGTTYLAKSIDIPVGSVMHFLDGKVVAEAGDVITIVASAGTALDVILSCMETS
tara:strand:- start:19 stop:324 length:306 start_codon:yes stop_codon:yes gene_type:complete